MVKVFVTDVRQAGHMDWPGSSSTNDTSILKPSEYLYIGASICMGNSLSIDPAMCPPPSPATFRTARVYIDNFWILMPNHRVSLECLMARCSDLSYTTTRFPLILARCVDNKILMHFS
ncbi:hypothetical protein L195_g013008 [Trifolium pratense]|uniref:Uncharacterized protein n=1 Tax=Trifolium pratense TaxID=57577 RepID=A0A2K3PLX9_TRIPR|nr:hypothetical protein L195_g013008 [Trifolium pratense]